MFVAEKVGPTIDGDATGTNFTIVFMTNVVRDIPSNLIEIDQIELYIAPLQRGTEISITAPAYGGRNGPNVNISLLNITLIFFS